MAVSEQLHLDRFAASARQALLDAQQQATQMQAQKVYLEHLLLAMLLSPARILLSSLTQRTGPAYTNAIDQLIQAKIGEPSNGDLTYDVGASTGIKVERPTITFADILGAETAKQELRDVITFL